MALDEEFDEFQRVEEQLPRDEIIRRLMDHDVFFPRLPSYSKWLRELSRESTGPTGELEVEFPSSDQQLTSAVAMRLMQKWQPILRERFACPRTWLSEAFLDRLFPQLQVDVKFVPSLNEQSAAQLDRHAHEARMYWENVRNDQSILCRSREALAKARLLLNYVTERCTRRPSGVAGKAVAQVAGAMDCRRPKARAEKHIGELEAIALENETKFKEKWSAWIDVTEIKCP
ncbi:MAG: hypothetical protein NDI61_04240 [Bdellovibrionaceae bacterium]|nr:hypothetical protein [Pseudobdellovibrionaceae bacterium]